MAGRRRRIQGKFFAYSDSTAYLEKSSIYRRTAVFFGMIGVFLIVSFTFPGTKGQPIRKRSTYTYDTPIYGSVDDIPVNILHKLDAILVLGGGKPLDLYHPPRYVQRRCDDAVAIAFQYQKYHKNKRKLPILCLSAGTAHLPQLLSPDGHPVWESTASAAYILTRYAQNITQEQLYVETTSYDTIGNAFYARSTHTDIQGWRNLLVVTNNFHMERSKAIFDWIFSMDDAGYELTYMASPDEGLSDQAIRARQEKEIQGLESIQHLSKNYKKLSQVWSFLNHDHSLYTAHKLIERAMGATTSNVSEAIKKSYGG